MTERPCTCPPREGPTPCAHRYALSECRAVAAFEEFLQVNRLVGLGFTRNSRILSWEDFDTIMAIVRGAAPATPTDPSPGPRDEALQDGGWLPIESHDDYGAWVFVYSSKWPIWAYPMVGWRDGPGDEWQFPAHPQWASEMPYPTHWQPLPAAPKSSPGDGAPMRHEGKLRDEPKDPTPNE